MGKGGGRQREEGREADRGYYFVRELEYKANFPHFLLPSLPFSLTVLLFVVMYLGEFICGDLSFVW